MGLSLLMGVYDNNNKMFKIKIVTLEERKLNKPVQNDHLVRKGKNFGRK